MQIKTNEKNSNGMPIIPREGSEDTFIERLIEYITYYDPEWIHRIQPASDELIQEYKQVSGITDIGKEIPTTYLEYLKAMGKNDGGLLKWFSAGGVSAIDYIIESYDLDMAPNYLMVFWSDVGVSFFMALLENNQIVTGEEVEYLEYFAENFEKMVFQHVFRTYNRNGNFISFGGSQLNVQEAKQRLGITNMIDYMDIYLPSKGFQKLWFSDCGHYIAQSEHLVFWSDLLYGYLVGFISGNSQEKVETLGTEIILHLGQEIQTCSREGYHANISYN